jgi:hypothetical protein
MRLSPRIVSADMVTAFGTNCDTFSPSSPKK